MIGKGGLCLVPSQHLPPNPPGVRWQAGRRWWRPRQSPALQVAFQYPSLSWPSLDLLSVTVFGLGLRLFMVIFFHSGFKGEASQRCSHTALGPTFKGSCSLDCVLQNQATGCKPSAENTVEQLAYEYLQVNQLSYRCQMCDTWLCPRAQNFASTVVSAPSPNTQTRPVPWEAEGGETWVFLAARASMLCWKAGGPSQGPGIRISPSFLRGVPNSLRGLH